MDHQEDRAFLRQFSGVIVGFMLLTVALIFLARYMQPELEGDQNPSQAILAEKRIAPVGAVRSGEEGAAALAAAQAAVVEAAPEGEAVVDGSAVYGGLCKTCHEAGVAGAAIVARNRSGSAFSTSAAQAFRLIARPLPRRVSVSS